MSAVFVHKAHISCQRETLYRSCNQPEFSGNHVRIVTLAVDLIVPYCVAHDVRADEIGLVGVIYLHSVFIHYLLVGTAHIKRIYRTHVVGDIEYVC